MTKAILDLGDFHKVAKGKRPRVGIRLAPAPGLSVAEGTEERVVSFVFSDASVDRYGDTIDPKGWVFDRSGAGTVALFGHDSSIVDNVVGRALNVRVQGDRLVGDIHFATAEENPNAEIVYQMVKGGYINSVSVGFQPIEWSQTKDKSRPGGIDFKKQELLEVSVVPIPANPNAIALAKAAGLDVDRLGLSTRVVGPVTKKGLYSVAWLASILQDLGWLASDVAWEAEYEGDGSEVPQMLADAVNQLGQALLTMTAEEVGELLAVDDSAVLPDMTSAQAAVAKLAACLHRDDDIFGRDAILRAGRVLSAATKKALGEACDTIQKGCESIRSMIDDAVDEATSSTAMEDEEEKAKRVRRAAAMKLAFENSRFP